MQHMTNKLPKITKFTCFSWLPTFGIFRNYQKLVACGTPDGQIVIIGLKNSKLTSNSFPTTSIHQISLSNFDYLAILFGHSTSITDISMTLDSSLFISISNESTICGWSTNDYSCIFRFFLDLNFGKFYFSFWRLCSNLIWIYRSGESVFLVNISNGEIISHYDYFGLKSFGVVRNPNGDSVAVCSGILNTTLFRIDDEFQFQFLTSIPHKLTHNEITKISNFGIIKITKNRWKILDPMTFSIINRGIFKELQDDDFIVSIEVDLNSTGFAAVSIEGKIFINKFSQFKLISENYFYIHTTHCFIDRFAFDSNSEIFFVSNNQLFYINRIVYSCQLRKVKNVVLYISNNDDIYFRAISTTLFIESFSGLIQKIKFKKKVTAICERGYPISQSSRIVVGFNDGSICFLYFDKIRHLYFILSEYFVLSDSVRGILNISSNNFVVAFGNDGSTCLFRGDNLLISFLTPKIPFLKIYYFPKDDLLGFQLINGIILIYSYKYMDPIHVLSKLPSSGELIWPVADLDGINQNATSTFSIQFGMNGFLFSSFNIVGLCHLLKNGKIEQAICMKLFKLLTGIQTHENDSLMLFGHQLIPTVYYNPINLEQIYNVSEFIGAILYISLHLLQNAFKFINLNDNSLNDLKNDGSNFIQTENVMKVNLISKNQFDVNLSFEYKQFAIFLPSLVQFLYYDVEEIRWIACNACIELKQYVTYQKCQEFLMPLIKIDDWYLFEDYEKFLMAILLIKYPKSLPEKYIQELFIFLDEKTVECSERAYLAITLIIDGFSLWTRNTNKEEKSQRYVSIINSIFMQQKKTELFDYFTMNIFIYLDSFCSSLNSLFVTSLNNKTIINEIIDIYLKIVQNSPDFSGPEIIDSLIKTSFSFPQYLNDINQKIQQTNCKFVKIVENVVVIGFTSGRICAYLDTKLLFDESVFNENQRIHFIDVGPHKKFAVATSNQIAKIFHLCEPTKRLFRSKRPRVLTEFQLDGKGSEFSILWKSPHECEIIFD